MRTLRQNAEVIREALATTLEDPRQNVYWSNSLHGTKTRIVNVRQNRSQLQVKQSDGWYAVTDPADIFTLE